MNFLLFYKGDYGSALRGPEMRYVALAEALIKLGCNVTILTKNADITFFSRKIQFVRLRAYFAVIKAFLRSDILVLHGGGPIILCLATVSGLLGKKIILDAYVPHWVELDDQVRQLGENKLKNSFKSMFNAFRSLFGVFVCDTVIVANQRQLDLMRGISAPFFRTSEFNKTNIIPFGCIPYVSRSKTDGIRLLNELGRNVTCLTKEDFLVGWLGGVYGWFDINSVLISILPALSDNVHIKVIFFGVDEQKQALMLSCLPSELQSRIIFLPWVPFANRLDYWAGLDLSLVWGADGYENDYASRTRNFDCLSLGLPILQNKDDEWGARLHDAAAGIVTTQNKLSEELLSISQDSHRLKKLKQGMIDLAPEFYWDKFAEKIHSLSQNKRLTFWRRLVGIFAVASLAPVVLILFFFAFISQQVSPSSS